MDITSFILSSRNQALLYGDYSTYHGLLAKKLHSCRKKLNIATRSRGKFTKKPSVTAAQIAENREHLHLLLLTAERAWAHALRLKAVHTAADTSGITGRARSHIISRLDKGARVAEHLSSILTEPSSGALPTDVLEARAYAALIRGAVQFERQAWEPSMRSYSTARIIYSALSASVGVDTFKDLLSETIDPSIRYAAYQIRIPRTLAIPTIARRAFPADLALAEQINQLDPSLLRSSDSVAAIEKSESSSAPQTINWRSREVKIEDATIAVALALTDSATQKLEEKLSEKSITLPREKAAAYEDVLLASQDAADATKHAIDELREEGVSQNDPRLQSLQITRTAVNHQMISWRIGRNRVLSGEHDGALLDSAPNTTRKAKKDAAANRPKVEATGRKIARLREKLVLYDATLQSIESIQDLPGVAADEGLLEQLEATTKYFSALRSLSIARSHSLADAPIEALALVKHAFDKVQEASIHFSRHASASSDSSPLSLEIRKNDVEFLHSLLRGELQRARALVEIRNLRAKASNAAGSSTSATAPLVQRLHEYPAEGVDLENLVVYPPKVQAVPVKPLFFDVAWNYIDYPGRGGDVKAPKASAEARIEEEKSSAASQKKGGWFGFGRT